jgi:hypothetical protein
VPDAGEGLMVGDFKGDKKGEQERDNLAWKRKMTELSQGETDRILRTRQVLKDWIRRSIDEYGHIPPMIRNRIDNVGRDLGITVEDVIEEVLEERVVGKKGSVDHEKLAVLLLQKAQRLREQNGGIMTLAEVQLMTETRGTLSGKVDYEDVKKAIDILSKQKLIPGIKKLSSGLSIVYFFPVEVSLDQNTVLAIASEKGWTTLEEVMTRAGWSRERAEVTLKELETSGISRPDPSYSTGKKWHFPGLLKH